MTKLRALVLWLILMWGGSAPIGVRAVGCPANIRLSRLTGAAPLSCIPPQHPNPPATATQVQRPNTAPTIMLANQTSSAIPTKISQVNTPTALPLTTNQVAPVKLQLIAPIYTAPVLNSVPILYIGRQKFENRCAFEMYLTTPFRAITCTLTAAEFASVADGDQVRFLYGTSLVFGPLNKSQLQMKEDLLLTRQNILDGMKRDRAQANDPHQITLLDTAIQNLTDTSVPNYWRDVWHLQPESGLTVFNKDLQILANLDLVTAKYILHLDHTLATVALEEARAAGGLPTEIADADHEVSQAGDDEFHFNYTNALTHYRDAWQHAMNAMSSVTPAPTITYPTPTTVSLPPNFFPKQCPAFVSGSSGKRTVSLVFYTTSPVQSRATVVDGSPTLFVGTQFFQRGWGGSRADGSLYKTIWNLTEADLDCVKDGDPIRIIYGDTWEFGALDKKHLTALEQLRSYKQGLANRLRGIWETASNTETKAQIDNAIQQLTFTAASERWLDGLHLQPAEVLNTLDADLSAAASLQQILLDPTLTEGNAQYITITLDAIVNIEGSVYALRYDELKGAGADPALLAAADKARTTGEGNSQGKYVDALTRDRTAWQSLLKASASIKSSPTITPSPTAMPTSTAQAQATPILQGTPFFITPLPFLVPTSVPGAVRNVTLTFYSTSLVANIDTRIRNAYPIPILIIGGRQFRDGWGGSVPDGYLFKTTWHLTDAELAFVKDGYPVEIEFGGRWSFGPLDKGHLVMVEQMVEQARSYLQELVDQLKGIRNTLPNTDTAARLDNAIQELTFTAASERWLDGWHLQPAEVLSTLDADLSAAASLQQVLLDPTLTEGNAQFITITLDAIVNLEGSVYALRYDELKGAGADPALLAAADKARTMGEGSSQGKYVDALTRDRAAWQYLLKASASIKSSPTITPSPTAMLTSTAQAQATPILQGTPFFLTPRPLLVPTSVPGAARNVTLTFYSTSLVDYKDTTIRNLVPVPILIIGGRQFRDGWGGSVSDGHLFKTTWHLTDAELAFVKDGYPVQIEFRGRWYFDPLDKKSLVMVEQARRYLQDLVDLLKGIRETLPNTDTAARLDNAIQQLSFTTASERWLDGLHLKPTEVLNTLDADLSAAASLQQILLDPTLTEGNAQFITITLDAIVNIEGSVYALRYDELKGAGADPTLLAAADKSRTTGEGSSQGKYVDALTRDRAAWQYLLKASASIKSSPTITLSPTAMLTSTAQAQLSPVPQLTPFTFLTPYPGPTSSPGAARNITLTFYTRSIVANIDTRIRDAAYIPILTIGYRQFQDGWGDSVPDGHLFKTTWHLTEAEFALVNDGSPVKIDFGGTWSFGPLDKGHLVMVEQARSYLQELMDQLKRIRETLTNTETAARLDNAIQQLTFTTASERWLDGLHLQPTEVLNTLNADLSAAASLQQVLLDPMLSKTDAQYITSALDAIVNLEGSVYALRYDELKGAGADPALLAAADKSRTTSEGSSQGKYVDALTRDRAAWQYLLKASASIKSSPTITPSPTATPTSTPSPTLNGSANVELKLITSFYSEVVTDMGPGVRIGPKLFQNNCRLVQDSDFKKGSLPMAVCSFTPAEFASLKNGDEVTLYIGYSWFFGPLNKSNLVMMERLDLVRQGTLRALKDLRAAVTNAHEAAQFDALIQQLSQLPTHWIDGLHLPYNEALAVYDADISASSIVQQLIDDPTTSKLVALSLPGIMEGPIRVDSGLLNVAFLDAIRAGVPSTLMTPTHPESVQTDGGYAGGFTRMRDSYQRIVNAIRSVTPTPTITPSTTATPAVTPGQG